MGKKSKKGKEEDWRGARENRGNRLPDYTDGTVPKRQRQISSC